MANRTATNSQTETKPDGLGYFDENSGLFKTLYDQSLLVLEDVTGSDTITATLDPPLPPEGLVRGMKFTIKWTETNTGPATLSIDGGPATSIVAQSGGAITPGQLAQNTTDILLYDGTNHVLLTNGADVSESTSGIDIYTTSQDWINNLPPDQMIKVEAVGPGGGGGSGGSGAGAGGGHYAEAIYRAGDLPGIVPMNIPPGGAVETDGEDCTFGTFLRAFGGERGRPDNPGRGGKDIVANPLWDGGDGADLANGLPALKGGAGGGGRSLTSEGGTSTFAGDGGGYQQAGQAPGGGGGSQAPGGRAEIRIIRY